MIGIPLPVDLLASLANLWLVGCTVLLGTGLGVAGWALMPDLRALIDGRDRRPERAHTHTRPPASTHRHAA